MTAAVARQQLSNDEEIDRPIKARRLAAAVLRAIEGAPDDASVGARARSLRTMCELLTTLADEVANIGGGQSSDDWYLWVPQERLAREMAHSEQLSAENRRLRATLATISEDGDVETGNWMDCLISDAAARERHVRDIATHALQASHQ